MKFSHQISNNTTNSQNSTTNTSTSVTTSSSNVSQIAASIITLAIVLILIIILFCCTRSKKSKNLGTVFRFPAGIAVVDACFGCSSFCRFIFTFVAILISSFASYQCFEYFTNQQYTISNLQFANVTAFIFTQNASDPIVHTNWAPISGVNATFNNSINQFQLNISNFTQYGAPTYVKLFIALNATQFLSVGDWLEYGFNTTVDMEYNLSCTISPVSNYSYSSNPTISYYGVNVAVYKTTYFNVSQGMFLENCSKVGKVLNQTMITIKYSTQCGGLSVTDSAVVLIAFTFITLGIISTVLIYMCFDAAFQNIAILRRYDEKQRTGYWNTSDKNE